MIPVRGLLPFRVPSSSDVHRNSDVARGQTRLDVVGVQFAHIGLVKLFATYGSVVWYQANRYDRAISNQPAAASGSLSSMHASLL